MSFRIAAVLFASSIGLNFVVMAMRADGWIVPGLLFGWILADFGSGLLHMLMDYVHCPKELGFDRLYFHQGHRDQTYAALKREVMAGRSAFYRLAFDFKIHHPWPDGLGRRSTVTLCRETLPMFGLPLSLLVNLAAIAGSLSAGWIAVGTTLAVGGAFAQYLHGQMHREPPARHVLVLRRLGLLMTPAAHRIHHDTLDRDFAIITGWTNPLLNPLFRVFRRLGICRDADLEPPRTEATRDLPSPDPRPGLAAGRPVPG